MMMNTTPFWSFKKKQCMVNNVHPKNLQKYMEVWEKRDMKTDN